MSRLVLLFLVVVQCVSTGCSTIVSGTSDELTFQSEPEGATIKINGRVMGKTPATITVQKAKNQTLVFEKEGYKEQTFALTTTLDGMFWGNFILGGLLGSTTDGMTGAIHEYSPKQYYATLVPDKSAFDLRAPSEEVRRFIVLNHDEIRAAIAMENALENELINGLRLLLKTQQSNADVVTVLSTLGSLYPDPVEFARKVAEYYGQ